MKCERMRPELSTLHVIAGFLFGHRRKSALCQRKEGHPMPHRSSTREWIDGDDLSARWAKDRVPNPVAETPAVTHAPPSRG